MSKTTARQGEDAPAREYTAEEQAAIKAAGAWINLLSRTLKTCRLYDGGNPTVARFRDELSASLDHLTGEHGALTFKITSEDLKYEGTSMYPAKSRDDNIALPFYRDGIHAITFHPGVDRRETDAVVDALLRVTGQNAGDDDLVTLLWDANLPHVIIETVPLEGEADGEAAAVTATFAGVLAQIAVLDIVFSLDSVITAVGMADDVAVMIIAIVLAVGVMMFSARPIGEFVDRHPTIKMLALSFLILVGFALMAEGLDLHVPKGYIYFAMAFSVAVEMLNLRMRAAAARRRALAPAAPLKLRKPLHE